MKKTFCFTLFLFCISSVSNGQVHIANDSLTLEQCIKEILLGEGIKASNFTFNGSVDAAESPNEQFGSFKLSGFDFEGLKSGIILGTGNVKMAAQNNAGNGEFMGGPGVIDSGYQDEDLKLIIGSGSLYDQCIIEFDFVPFGDTLTFDYVFASEEYDEYVCGIQNDAFGFFLTGPNPDGGEYESQNIALIPDTNDPTKYTNTPVSINTLNSGQVGLNGEKENCEKLDPHWRSYKKFYKKNEGTDYEYDGRTIALTAFAKIECGETYHIKIAVGDVDDNTFDSGVFISGGSFSAAKDFVKSFTDVLGGDTVLHEGCNPGGFEFIRQDSTQAETIQFTISGDAENGTDFETITADLTFQAGQSVDTVLIDPIRDQNTEPIENVIVKWDKACKSAILQIKDVAPLEVTKVSEDTIICYDYGEQGKIMASAEGGFGNLSYSWSNDGGNAAINLVSPLVTTDYQVTVFDECGRSTTFAKGVKITVECPLKPVNVFTPNGDGVNDLFKIGNLADLENVELVVYNRWGKVVYKTDKYDNSWNGTFMDSGNPCPAGIYTYVITTSSETYDYLKLSEFQSDPDKWEKYEDYAVKSESKYSFSGHVQILK